MLGAHTLCLDLTVTHQNIRNNGMEMAVMMMMTSNIMKKLYIVSIRIMAASCGKVIKSILWAKFSQLCGLCLLCILNKRYIKCHARLRAARHHFCLVCKNFIHYPNYLNELFFSFFLHGWYAAFVLATIKAIYLKQHTRWTRRQIGRLASTLNIIILLQLGKD